RASCRFAVRRTPRDVPSSSARPYPPSPASLDVMLDCNPMPRLELGRASSFRKPAPTCDPRYISCDFVWHNPAVRQLVMSGPDAGRDRGKPVSELLANHDYYGRSLDRIPRSE